MSLTRLETLSTALPDTLSYIPERLLSTPTPDEFKQSFGDQLTYTTAGCRFWHIVDHGLNVWNGTPNEQDGLFSRIHSYLNDNLHRIPRTRHEQVIKAFMVGLSQQSALPTVIVQCSDYSVAKQIRRLLQKGVLRGHIFKCKTLPWSIRLLHNSEERLDPLLEVKVYASVPKEWTTACGLSIGFPRYQENLGPHWLPNSELRLATQGGLVYIGQEVWGLTVAHAMRGDLREPTSETMTTVQHTGAATDECESVSDGEDFEFLPLELADCALEESSLHPEASEPSQKMSMYEAIGITEMPPQAADVNPTDCSVFRITDKSIQRLSNSFGEFDIKGFGTPSDLRQITLLTASNGSVSSSVVKAKSLLRTTLSVVFSEVVTVQLEEDIGK